MEVTSLREKAVLKTAGPSQPVNRAHTDASVPGVGPDQKQATSRSRRCGGWVASNRTPAGFSWGATLEEVRPRPRRRVAPYPESNLPPGALASVRRPLAGSGRLRTPDHGARVEQPAVAPGGTHTQEVSAMS